VRQAFLCPLQRAFQLTAPLRNGEAQPPHEVRQARGRQGCVQPDRYIDERIETAAAFSGVCWARFVRSLRVDANAVVAARDAQETAIVHRVQQVSGGVR
jgi:hypothetical protein